MITYKKDNQYLFLNNLNNFKTCGGKNANILELRNHTDVEETSTEFCLIVKTNWRGLAR